MGPPSLHRPHVAEFMSRYDDDGIRSRAYLINTKVSDERQFLLGDWGSRKLEPNVPDHSRMSVLEYICSQRRKFLSNMLGKSAFLLPLATSASFTQALREKYALQSTCGIFPLQHRARQQLASNIPQKTLRRASKDKEKEGLTGAREWKKMSLAS